ncbi:RagB/SusD family nutrient uptake outer membrane protein [Bacteroides congonensis]|mgnify:FL=1|uniref:RagB/SusD family nutrient uptake outer membrane protein n=1 Tax=Bacteroides congonensis TaxID=1871006 RepID=UPI002FD8999A
MRLSITKYILLLCGIIPLLTSCEDFLDKQETEDITFEQLWEKRAYTRGYFLNAMSFLPNDLTSYVSTPQSTATDELINASNAGAESMNTGAWNASNVPGANFNLYNGIRECNIFMQNVYSCTDPTVTQEEKDEWYWYTRWARAYYYFLIMRNYGPVFLLGDEILPYDATTESLYRPRNTWEQCVEYVTDEMGKCGAYFKEHGKTTWTVDAEYGLPTEGAALAVISRLRLYSARDLYNGNTLYNTVKNPVTPDFPELSEQYLFPQDYNNDKWKEAVLAAKAVIDLGVYELHRDAATPDDPYANYLGITQTDWNKELIWSTGYASREIVARRTTPTGVKTKKGGNGAAYGALGPSQQQVDAYAMDNGIYPITGYEADGTPEIDRNSGYTESGTTNFENPFLKYLSKGDTYQNKYYKRTTRNMFVNREPRFYIAVYWSDSYWRCGPGKDDYVLCNLAKDGNSNTSHDHSRGGYLLNRFCDHTASFVNNQPGNMVFPTFRLGEIYLNFIEAALEWEKRTGDNQYHAKAMEYWADLRDRSGMSPITDVYPGATIDQLIEYCRQERRIELAFENHRFFDTRTWMIATTTDNGPIYGMNVEAQAVNADDTPDAFWRRTVVQNRVFRANHFLYPFSQRELDRNKLLTQNYKWR